MKLNELEMEEGWKYNLSNPTKIPKQGKKFIQK
jgi:hypothetical protein